VPLWDEKEQNCPKSWTKLRRKPQCSYTLYLVMEPGVQLVLFWMLRHRKETKKPLQSIGLVAAAPARSRLEATLVLHVGDRFVRSSDR